MFKKIPALLLSAAILASSSVTAFAETAQTETAAITQTLGASQIEWNGKTALEAGKSYIVSKNVTISKSVTIPAKTTLTVKSGAKLWIGSKGKLLVKGTLKLQKKSTLAVTGTLNLYKGKVLSSSGEVRFGNKSTVTLSGKFTSTQYGSVTGEPKKLTVGDSAVIKITGNNSSKKLAAALNSNELTAADEQEVKELFGQVLDGVLIEKDIMKAYSASFPADVLEQQKKEYEDAWKEMDEEMQAMYVPFEEAINSYAEFVVMLFEYSLGGSIASVEITDFSMEPVDVDTVVAVVISPEYADAYKNIEKAAVAKMEYIITADNGKTEESETTKTFVVKMNGKWYMTMDGSSDISVV